MVDEPMPVTPVVLARDEEANLGRTLESLRWARRVVVLDSGSTDGTRAISAGFPNVAWYERPFDDFGRQWGHALRETGIDTEFVLALDADMAVPAAFVREIREGFLPSGLHGGLVPFEYRYRGRALRGSLYPPQVRLVRRARAETGQRGHAHEIRVDGPVYRFRARVVHDDRKPLSRWVSAQARYAGQEAERIGAGGGGWKGALRRLGVAPPLVLSWAWLRAGGPLGGAAACRYAMERCAFESLLGAALADRRLRGGGGDGEGGR